MSLHGYVNTEDKESEGVLTAANVEEDLGKFMSWTDYGFDHCEQGDELVRRSDHEEAMEHVRKQGKQEMAARLYCMITMETGLETKVEIQEKIEDIIKSYRPELAAKTPRQLTEKLREEIASGDFREKNAEEDN